MTMSQLLTSKGWRIYYSCNCNGSPREFYTNIKFPGYEVRVRPRRQTFTVLQHNHTIAGPHFGYQLEEKLKQFNIYE